MRLFVGMTTWNSATFLQTSLAALRAMTDSRNTQLVVFDNCSTDATVEIARRFGAKVVQRQGSQGQALIDLFNLSSAEFTLLIHADVVLLNRGWLDVCAAHLAGDVALVSPEDIGCGPFTRPWGSGMPESSFLFFRTALARHTRVWFRRQRFKMRLPYRGIDFFGEHITYNLPNRLRAHGLEWRPMRVHTSARTSAPIYTPRFDVPHWNPELAMYRYGLGNFYSLDGLVTHYHNWFERAVEDVTDDSERTLPAASGGLPLAFLKRYTRSFVDDYARGTVHLPDPERG